MKAQGFTFTFGDARDATEIIATAFTGQPGQVASAMRWYRLGFRVVLDYGSIARMGPDSCCYWPDGGHARD